MKYIPLYFKFDTKDGKEEAVVFCVPVDLKEGTVIGPENVFGVNLILLKERMKPHE